MTTHPDAMQELAEIRALARDFAGAEIRPNVEGWDHAAGLPDAVVAQLAELGFLGMLVDEAHGGMGFDAATFVAAVEELAWGDASVATLVVAHAVASEWLGSNGGDAGVSLLPDLAAGRSVATCSVLAGADVDGARWLARPRGAAVAVFPSAEAFAAAKLDGARIGVTHATLGLRALALADAEPVADATLAEAAADFGPVAVLGASAVAVGTAAAALEHARDYAAEREQFGQPIRTFEGIAAKLGDMQVRLAAARTLSGAAARGAASPEVARVFAADAAMWVTTQAVQIFGGYGYMRDYPVERLMRDAKAAALLFGENDALRVAVAESLYRG